MDRMACVNCPALPLQLLVRAHPDWRGRPVVVVDRDKPNGVIQWTNTAARGFRIFPGMRYAAGLALAPELRGGEVADALVGAASAELTQRLWDFSPRVEPSPEEPGVFWADVSGMGIVYPSLGRWAEAVREDFRGAGFQAVVAVGFSRFGSYVAARSRRENIVFTTPAEEQACADGVPVSHLRLEAGVQDTLYKLGIETVGQFLSLPARGLRKRFGAEAEAIYRLAKGSGWRPLQPLPVREAVTAAVLLDYPETDCGRLVARLAELLRGLLSELEGRHENLRALHWRFVLDNGGEASGELIPAAPTRDANQILRLARLHLEQRSFPSGVVELEARAEGQPISQRQTDLFQEAPRRNLAAAARAFAAIRAELGNDAVVAARLGAGHLPEAQYCWEALGDLPRPKPVAVASAPLVRRIYRPAIPLPPRDRHEPDGWLIAGVSEGPVEEVIGPQLINGGWWRGEVSRAYYYARTRSNRWFWIYHDLRRRRWYLQGEVQ
ncbi:MAG: DNA polymerase Y family protein [Candidatus Hydrogenedentes bacterium]|nr:DNA polymerase Y family protein [Candidatus Hydrogenedentota bacterium]